MLSIYDVRNLNKTEYHTFMNKLTDSCNRGNSRGTYSESLISFFKVTILSLYFQRNWSKLSLKGSYRLPMSLKV